MKRWAPLALAALVLSFALPAWAEDGSTRRLKVGVLPFELEGEGDAKAASKIFVDALRGLPELEVIALFDLASLLGREAETAVAACRDDPCRWTALGSLSLDRLVIGSITDRGAETELELRLIGAGEGRASVSARVPGRFRDLRGQDLSRELANAAQRLFPEQAARSLGRLEIRSDVEGSEVWIDGQPQGTAPTGPSAIASGKHEVKVSAKGYEPFVRQVEILTGQEHLLQAELTRIRSGWHWVLGAGSVVVLGAGLALGASAQATADGWAEACGGGASCDPGYDRARFGEDRDSVSLRRGIANGLFVTGGVLAVAALVSYVWDPFMAGEP